MSMKHIWIAAILLLMMAGSGMAACQATVSYSSATNTITVANGGDGSWDWNCVIGDVANTTAITWTSSGIVFLNANVTASGTSTHFYQNSTNVTKLRINSSTQKPRIQIRINGLADIDNTIITSYNTTTASQEGTSTTRAQILITGASSVLNLSNSSIIALGGTGFDSWGLVFNTAKSGTVENNTITNNTIGILGYHTNGLNISNNTIMNTTIGIHLGDSYGNDLVDGNYISNTSSTTGILFESTSTIINNIVYNNTRTGIQTDSDGSNNSVIQNNTIYGNEYTTTGDNGYYGGGIYLQKSNNNSIQNNTVYRNKAGIHLESNSTNNSIISNIVYNNTYYYGINLELYVNLTTIENNTVYNNTYGIALCVASNNIITNNLIYDQTQTGLYFECGGNNYNNIDYNNIYDNGQRDIYFRRSTLSSIWYGGHSNNLIQNNILDDNKNDAYDNIILFNLTHSVMGQISTNNSFINNSGWKYYASTNSSLNITNPSPINRYFNLITRGDAGASASITKNNTILQFNPAIDYTVYPTYLDIIINTNIQTTYNISLLNASITPSSDSITVNITTWNTTGDYYKKWNESSSNITNTARHIIGDFPVNTSIQIKRDGVNYTTVTSNTTGYIDWTYSGGYSEHMFELELGSPSIDIVITYENRSNSPYTLNFTLSNNTGITSLNFSYNATDPNNLYSLMFGNGSYVGNNQTAASLNQTIWFNFSQGLPDGDYYLKKTTNETDHALPDWAIGILMAGGFGTLSAALYGAYLRRRRMRMNQMIIWRHKW